MALENVMRVDNGNVVTGGGAGGNSTEIDWEDWCKLTPEEQETGDWTIINCPWADGNVSVDLMTKLWENPSPTSAMADGTAINLSSSDYDYLMVVYRYSKSVATAKSVILPKGSRFFLDFASTSSNGCETYRRNLNYVSNTSYTASSAYEAHGATATTVNNDYVIPIAIYGIKTTASVKINAIAMDVSTSADKCMLSENESVKDRIGDILFVEKSISNKSISTVWGSMFTANETVDISSLGLSNAPDVVSATFGTTETRIALCAAASINKNNISVSLLRAESGTVSGKIIITLKSNG